MNDLRMTVDSILTGDAEIGLKWNPSSGKSISRHTGALVVGRVIVEYGNSGD